jgi:formamidopyrimidine-DNA glycosylase
MPELPEVETIVRSLRDGGQFGPSVLHRRVDAAYVDWPKTIAEPDAENFKGLILGRSVESINRRGKYIVMHLDEGYLLIHLRMSGDLRVEPDLDETGEAIPFRKHDRMVLTFADGYRLAFFNPRKFGRVWLTDDLDHLLGKLGPEPLDEALTAERFYEMLNGHKRQIKPLLMDQNFIAGMGNIYTDEALFASGIHPLTGSNQITSAQAETLLTEMRYVLKEGIRRNGSSIDWAYRGGEFQNEFQVYQRTGEDCPVCSTPIERIVVGQRGTHFCPHCQPILWSGG